MRLQVSLLISHEYFQEKFFSDKMLIYLDATCIYPSPYFWEQDMIPDRKKQPSHRHDNESYTRGLCRSLRDLGTDQEKRLNHRGSNILQAYWVSLGQCSYNGKSLQNETA
jgi:hypothetical protein